MTSHVTTMLFVLSGVNSDFDFCQSAIKKIFNDEELMTTLRDATGYCLRQATYLNNSERESGQQFET